MSYILHDENIVEEKDKIGLRGGVAALVAIGTGILINLWPAFTQEHVSEKSEVTTDGYVKDRTLEEDIIGAEGEIYFRAHFADGAERSFNIRADNNVYQEALAYGIGSPVCLRTTKTSQGYAPSSCLQGSPPKLTGTPDCLSNIRVFSEEDIFSGKCP